MSTSALSTEFAVATDVKCVSGTLVVKLRDGRVLSVPLSWYPRLAAATPSERRRWELVGPGIGIHWPAVDEDISVEALLRGLGSNESPRSLRRWQAARRQAARRRAASKAPPPAGRAHLGGKEKQF